MKKFLVPLLFSLSAHAIDGFNAGDFMFGKHKMSADVFKQDTYFVHLRNITSQDFVSKSNPQGKYRFSIGEKSLQVGDKFCKSILGQEYKQVMTDAGGEVKDDPFLAELREIRCQREKNPQEIVREQEKACGIFQRPTVFAPNCPDKYAQKAKVNNDGREIMGENSRSPAIVKTSGSSRR
jgi:hypothetical protein